MPVLAYLFARMLAVGLRGARGEEPWTPAPMPLLLAGLGLLVAVRVGYNLLEGPVNDVGYAGVVGADSILHGWPLYTGDDNHLDTYGPVNYLAYVPASIVFPMAQGWARDGLAAAHATSIAVDLITLGMLVVLGRRLREGCAGTHLGVALAFLYAACPWTFLGLALGTNDGLIGLLLVCALVTLRSPGRSGALLGLGAAVKLSPVALLPLVAAGGGWNRGRAVRVVGAFAGVVALAFLAFLPDGGVRELWDATVGFQLDRRSFHSLWGQYPGLAPLQAVLKAAVIGMALGLAFVPRRRDLAQVASLAAAVLLGLQLVLQYWTWVYVGWFVPLLIVALAVREDRVPVGEEAAEASPAADARRTLPGLRPRSSAG